MPADQPPNQPEPPLLDAVRSLPDKKLRNVIERVDGLSKEDEEHLDRGGNFALRAVRRKLVRWGCYLGFGGLATIAAIGLGLIVGIAVLYMDHLVLTPGGVEGAMSSIVNFLFGVFVTIAGDHLLKKIKKD